MYKTIESGHMFTIHEKEQYLITKKINFFLKAIEKSAFTASYLYKQLLQLLLIKWLVFNGGHPIPNRERIVRTPSDFHKTWFVWGIYGAYLSYRF